MPQHGSQGPETPEERRRRLRREADAALAAGHDSSAVEVRFRALTGSSRHSRDANQAIRLGRDPLAVLERLDSLEAPSFVSRAAKFVGQEALNLVEAFPHTQGGVLLP